MTRRPVVKCMARFTVRLSAFFQAGMPSSAALLQPARTHDDVGLQALRRSQQGRYFFRLMVHVGVHGDDVVCVGWHGGKPQTEGTAKA